MLLRTDPFREPGRPTAQPLVTAGRPVTVPMDGCEREGAFWVHLDLPAVDPDGIDLSAEQNLLTVHAERPAPEASPAGTVAAERPHGSSDGSCSSARRWTRSASRPVTTPER
ncbi:hypothetical protein SUDANB176_05990 [Streptomyces sp. enrichment culture]